MPAATFCGVPAAENHEDINEEDDADDKVVQKQSSPAVFVRNRASTDAMAKLLMEHAIDTTTFGRGEAKSMENLKRELKDGSSKLTLDETRHRNLVRVTDIVILRVWIAIAKHDLFLIEASERFSDGRERKDLYRLPGSKRLPQESTQQTVIRILRTELAMQESWVSFQLGDAERFEEEQESKSFPGVRTIYKKEIVPCEITIKSEEILGKINACHGGDLFVNDEKTGSTKHFKWLCAAQCQDMSVKLWPVVVEESDSEDDNECEEAPPEYLSERRGGVSVEVHGAWNKKKALLLPKMDAKTRKQCEDLVQVLRKCPLFHSLDDVALDSIVNAMPLTTYTDGECIVQQGEAGDTAFAILEGAVDCYRSDDPSSSSFEVSPTNSVNSEYIECPGRGLFVRTMTAGRFFGEVAMLWSIPRTRSIYAREHCVVATLAREDYQDLVMRWEVKKHQGRVEDLRRVKMLETLSDEQMARLVDTLECRTYQAGEVIIRQNDQGDEMFVVKKGECSTTIMTGTDTEKVDKQEHKRYTVGDLFGERALIRRVRRAATITAVTNVELFVVRRSKFERMLGPLDQLQKVKYMTDPRKIIADFYRPGKSYGPSGACHNLPQGLDPNGNVSHWFAVYRPTSPDAINKLLNGIAVGKGLNVKGKSAKKNRLRSFVPFLQISQNSHKSKLEPSPQNSRIKVFFTTSVARDTARSALEAVGEPGSVKLLDAYDIVYGLDVSEQLLRKVYIDDVDISSLLGWETGRQSEPHFMNTNFHAVREPSYPEVVLYQVDVQNALNPHGLLIAYAERTVKPVVSDFDTLLVGSTGMDYETLIPEQAALAAWALDESRGILESPSTASWTTRWLEVLRTANEKGFHPKVPEYGFGDATSYRLIKSVVEATKESGAVRHGAECFNYWFPQELDESYLVIWQEFEDKPWTHMSECELREFLLDRINEGFTFPLNPIWPVRDQGWYDVFEALRQGYACKQSFNAWYPPDSGIVQKIQDIHSKFPSGFERSDTDEASVAPRGTIAYSDLEGSEKAEFMLGMLDREGATLKQS